jgi:thymidylate synthase
MKNENYLLTPYDISLRKILEEGFDIDGDRTGVGTRCYFGINTEYDISERIPLLTKRKIIWQSIVKEVLWYISGSNNINDLELSGSKIWSSWKNKEFEELHNLDEGSGGAIYGFNLIHFGADLDQYESAHKAIKKCKELGLPINKDFKDELDLIYPKSKGFNQIDYVINTLRNNPKSRQACFTFWRPDTNYKAILPACHAFYSFNVSPDENGELKILNLHMFQRSNDWFVGVGCGNLLTGSVMTYMIAQQLGMKPGKLYHSGSHCHIYHNQLISTGQYELDPIREYLSRTDEPDSPKLILNKKSSIYDYTIEDFNIIGYNPLSGIKVPIAI